MRSNNRNHALTVISPSPPPSTASSESSSDYAFTLTRIAVSQICNSIGFTSAEASALRTLTDVAVRYLRSIAKSAADSANSAGRLQSNLVDAVAAVAELSSVSGFPGAWRATGSLLCSGVVKELDRFSMYSDEIPFAKPLPGKIYLRGKGRGLRNVVNCNEYIGGQWKHIPIWLPVMPVIAAAEAKGGGRKREAETWGVCGGSDEIRREVKTTTTVSQSRTSLDGLHESETKGEDICMESEREKKGIKKLPLKRGKVRFKIGNNGVLGVCKRGGIGKRVLCESWVDDDENQMKNRSSTR